MFRIVCCLPDLHSWSARYRRRVVVIVLYAVALTYAPLLLASGVPVQVVASAAPPVITATMMLTRRVTRATRSERRSTPACA